MTHADELGNTTQEPSNSASSVATSVGPANMDSENEVRLSTDYKSTIDRSSSARPSGPSSIQRGLRLHTLDEDEETARLDKIDLKLADSVNGTEQSVKTDNKSICDAKADILLDAAEGASGAWGDSGETEDSEATEILEGGFQSLRDPRQPLPPPRLYVTQPTPPRLARHKKSFFIAGDTSGSSESPSPPPRFTSTGSISRRRSSPGLVNTAPIIAVQAAPTPSSIGLTNINFAHPNEQRDAQVPIIDAAQRIEVPAAQASPPAPETHLAQGITQVQAPTPLPAAVNTQEATPSQRNKPLQSQRAGSNPGAFRSRAYSRVRYGSRSERGRIWAALNRSRLT